MSKTKSQAEKAPAYQWYPKDARTDEAFMLMTWQERGIYRDLLDHQWLHGSIPSDPAAVYALTLSMGGGTLTPEQFTTIWPKISPCFEAKQSTASRLVNQRLERQRIALLNFKETKAVNGRAGGLKSGHTRRLRMRSSATNSLEAKRSSSSATASAGTTPLQNSGVGNPAPDLFDKTEAPNVSALVVLWNTERKPGPKVNAHPADARKDRYARALKAQPNLNDWRTVIHWLNQQAFANASGKGDYPNWRASLDWLTKPGKLAEYLEKARLDATTAGSGGRGGLVGRDATKGRTGVEPGKYDHLTTPAPAATATA